MKPPRGIKLSNERIENGHLVYDVTVKRWRMALMVLSVFRRGRFVAKRPA